MMCDLVSTILKSTSLTQIPSILVISIQRVLDIVQLEQLFYNWKQQPVINQWLFQPFVSYFIFH